VAAWLPRWEARSTRRSNSNLPGSLVV